MTKDRILMVITITETNNSGDDIYYRAHVQDSRASMQKVSLQPAKRNIIACAASVTDYLLKD